MAWLSLVPIFARTCSTETRSWHLAASAVRRLPLPRYSRQLDAAETGPARAIQRRPIRSEVAATVFQLCSAGGLVLGLSSARLAGPDEG